MINSILKLIFGSKHERDVKKLAPIIEKINHFGEKISHCSDYDLRQKTDEFIERCKNKESLDDILAEAFAVVRETANRRMGIWQIFKENFDFDTSCLSKDSLEEYENTIKLIRKGEDQHTVFLTAKFYQEVKAWKPDDLLFQHRPFDVQLMGATVLHQGKIAELKTGEGKTLMAVHTAYLNSLQKNSVHIITPNDYLAKRDSEWMSPIYNALGITVGALENEMSDRKKQEIYNRDVIYGTNNEFGFDYLRDNMKTSRAHLVQRDHAFAIVDEVDSILVDEARTPLIISGPSEESIDKYYTINKVIPRLIEDGKDDENQYFDVRFRNDEKFRRPTEILIKNDTGEYILDERARYFKEGDGNLVQNKFGNLVIRDEKYVEDTIQRYIHSRKKGNEGKLIEIHNGDYQVDEKSKSSHLTEQGVRKIEKLINIDNLFSPKNQEIVHHIDQALKAHKMFKKDVDYVVKEGKVLIVDEFTGRIKHGSRFSEGLHQALEAKENVTIEQENQTLGTITIQNYFRMYKKLAGMTGTADTEAAEFKKIYKLDVVVVPTNLSLQRMDFSDRIYRTKREKLNAIAFEVDGVNKNGQPILIGTASIEASEELSKKLKKSNIKHNVLNAKYHELEAEIITNAGQLGAVTIATNMAGRGTDIKLGAGVKDKGGLYILGTERHESRRIDNQLRGRSGRQGDPGCSRFYLSLEDDLMRIFGSNRLSNIMLRLGMEEGQEIEHPLVSRAIASAQKKVEGHNFDIRKNLLEYDEVMNKQREYIYGERDTFLKGENDSVLSTVNNFFPDVAKDVITIFASGQIHPQDIPFSEIENYILSEFFIRFSFSKDAIENGNSSVLSQEIEEALLTAFKEKTNKYPKELIVDLERYIVIQTIDDRWKEHLLEMDHLKEGFSMHWVAQKNPLTEYKFKGFEAFEGMIKNVKKEIVSILLRVDIAESDRFFDDQSEEMENYGIESHSDFDTYALASNDNSGNNSTGKNSPSQGIQSQKVSRNSPCPCGSGKKYKHCCGR